jgi:uncharacterized membrane protein
MNFAQTFPLADGWGMHGGGAGWWIAVPVLMMLFMGGMMWMMMRGMGGGSSESSPAASESRATTETPVQILERRFAEGAISVEEYQASRDALLNGSAGSNGTPKDEPLTAAQAAEGRQS